MFTRVLALGLAVSGFMARGQSPAAPTSEQSTLEALLNEVRALRFALERTNQLGPRIQIALARMQFQEERVRAITRQLESAHNEVSSQQNRRGELADRIKLVESQVNQISDPNTRKQLDYDLAQMKSEVEHLNYLEQQARAHETEVNLLLQNEQSKWNEINGQLGLLERALSPAQSSTLRP